MKKTKIINASKNIVLSENAQIAKSPFSRIKGLMFSCPNDMVLVAKKDSLIESEIHMCFMRYPIDVLWVNSKFEIVDKCSAEPVNIFKRETLRFYRPKVKAKYTIELGSKKKKVTDIADIGDKILFEPEIE